MRLRCLLFSAILLPLFTSARARADLIIDLLQVGTNEVQISWSGSGTLAANTDTVLDFTAFSGSPFGVTGSFGLTAELALNVDGFPSLYNRIVLTSGNGFQLLHTDDLLSPSLSTGSAYEGLASVTSGGDPEFAKIKSLSFASLTPGTYISSSGDSAAFGTVTLNVSTASVAVPEPSQV